MPADSELDLVELKAATRDGLNAPKILSELDLVELKADNPPEQIAQGKL